jgi:hypothetical protein
MSGKVFVPQKHILLLCDFFLIPAIPPSALLLFADGCLPCRPTIFPYQASAS